MLEAMSHEENTFVTLTYNDDNVPGYGLDPAHTRDWLKRLRKSIEPRKIRYYLVGEYGDVTHRPHYHAALFNYPNCLWGKSRYTKTRLRCCTSCDLLSRTWGHGNVLLGDLTPQSAQYTAGYIIKKMASEIGTQLDRTPEFSRMSLGSRKDGLGGLGSQMMHDVASTLLKLNLEKSLDDVPVVLRHGKKQYPIGRYLRGQLRELIGREKSAPPSSYEKIEKELSLVRQASFASSPFVPVKTLLIDVDAGPYARLEGKQRIYNSRKKL